MNVQDFVNEWNGRLVPSRGGILGQCVSLVQAWAQENGIGGTPVFPVGAAKDLAGVRGDTFNFTANTPDGVPPAGAIAIFNGRMGGGYGHTGVVVSADKNTINMFQQNDPYGSGGSVKAYNYNNVIGWLTLKNQGGGENVIADADNEYARWNKAGIAIRGRGLSRDEFRNAAVGKTWLQALEILSDNPEADAAQHAQEVGQVAVRDQWDKQIYGLQDQLKAQKATSDGQIADLTKQIEALKKQLGSATGIDPTTQAQIAETNNIVKQIWNKISSIFK